MPFISVDESPLASSLSSVEIYYREIGSGSPLLFLHGGWGYQIYPFDRQLDELSHRFRILIPDRTGYGRSMRLEYVPTDFHQRAATETLHLLDALHIERAVLWGHSDGAVIAAMIGLTEPERVSKLILEAFHFYRKKPGSREFFETMAGDPALLGERVATTLSSEHGKDYWRKLIVMNGEAWLRIADEASHQTQDLYDGRLSSLQARTLFVHGSRDPRTEPGEMEAVRDQLLNALIETIEGGGHAPHSESASAAVCNRVASEFLESIGE